MGGHDLHHHWHLDGVMNYQLLVDAKPKPKLVKPNSKVAFCLADIAKVDPTLPGFPTAPAFNGLRPGRGDDVREHGHLGRLGGHL